MAGTAASGRAAAARRTGTTVMTFVALRRAGWRWCSRCRCWQPGSAFSGNEARCRSSRRKM